MSLATRCPSCDTCFRVVPDQLRLAQGWVRCGRCEEVFLASAHLVETPPPAGSAARAEPSPPGSLTDDGTSARPRTGPQASIEGHALLVAEHLPGSGSPSLDEAWASSTGAGEAGTRYAWDPAPSPDRSRVARRLTACWVTSVIAGTLGLALQGVYAWRHDIASYLPVTGSALQAACQWLDCEIEPVRRLADLSVESSQLSQWGGTIYRIALVLRNRADRPLTLPMLDLTLTDVRGSVIARKALAISDFGVMDATIGPRQEIALQGYLNAGDPGVAGYTIELFHP